jgi:hypothetical protein
MVVSRSDLFHARSLPLASRSERLAAKPIKITINPHGENVNRPSKCADLSFSSRSIKEISWLTRAIKPQRYPSGEETIASIHFIGSGMVAKGAGEALQNDCVPSRWVALGHAGCEHVFITNDLPVPFRATLPNAGNQISVRPKGTFVGRRERRSTAAPTPAK